MKSVREIMSPVVFCVEESTFLPQAARSLRKYSVTGVPVVNGKGDYVGVLSQTDITEHLAKSLDTQQSMQELLEGELPEDLQSVRVKDVMNQEIYKISITASLEELGQSLLVAGVHRLFVTEEQDIVGLVTTTDLIHGFLNPEEATTKSSSRLTRKPYCFETELSYGDDGLRLKGSFGEELCLEPPPEFGGKEKHMSPEDLFVASISSCMCLTFMEFAQKESLQVLGYKCRAIGRLEGDGFSLRFTRVDLYPEIEVSGSAELVEKILMQAKLRCLVGRSSDVLTVLHPRIETRVSQDISTP